MLIQDRLKMPASNAYAATKSRVNSWSANNWTKNISCFMKFHITQLYTATNVAVISRSTNNYTATKFLVTLRKEKI